MRDEAGFRAFVEANSATLLHAARLLTGDYHAGEDLVQQTLAKVYRKWGGLSAPLAYARTTLVRSNIDSARRHWRGEQPTASPPEVADDHPDAGDAAASRDQLRRLLRTLPARERAVIVLRYYCDLSEQDTAESLGIPLGTVKSTASRALAKLRVAEHAPADGGSTP